MQHINLAVWILTGTEEREPGNREWCSTKVGTYAVLVRALLGADLGGRSKWRE